MSSRREFLQYAAAATVVATSPVSTMAKKIANMPRRQIPGTDDSLGIIGFGNARVFQQGDMIVSNELIDKFLDHGGSCVDTSGEARDTIGTIMRERNAHEQLFLGTYIDGKNLSAMRAEIREVLDVQGGESLDLVVSRAPDDFGQRRDEYQQLKEDGLTRNVGVGRPNKRFYPMIMKLMEDDALDFIQINYSMMEPEAANEILPLAVERDVAVVINRPFINGEYFSIVKDQVLPEWADEFDCKTWAQFSLKYILANPAVNCVLTETSNPKHALDNFGAAYGRLPDADTRRKMENVIRSLM